MCGTYDPNVMWLLRSMRVCMSYDEESSCNHFQTHSVQQALNWQQYFRAAAPFRDQLLIAFAQQLTSPVGWCERHAHVDTHTHTRRNEAIVTNVARQICFTYLHYPRWKCTRRMANDRHCACIPLPCRRVNVKRVNYIGSCKNPFHFQASRTNTAEPFSNRLHRHFNTDIDRTSTTVLVVLSVVRFST